MTRGALSRLRTLPRSRPGLGFTEGCNPRPGPSYREGCGDGFELGLKDRGMTDKGLSYTARRDAHKGNKVAINVRDGTGSSREKTALL